MDEKYPKRKEHITYKELPEENELLLVDERKNEAHVLNADAGGVWLLCNGKRSQSDMVRVLKESLPKRDEAKIASQLDEILTFLDGAELLE